MARRLAQKTWSGRSNIFGQQEINDEISSFTIWNLKKDAAGVKTWSPVGMGTTTGVAIEKFTAPNETSIEPVSQPPRPVVFVAVNEYPPFVYKVDPSKDDGCFGRFVPCYEKDPIPKTFCCFGVSLDFLSFLQQDLNFDVHIYFAPDAQHGVMNDSDGSWNEIVQELISGRAMLSLEMGLNRRRAEVISFAHPTLLLELGILVNKNNHTGTNTWLTPHFQLTTAYFW